MKKAADILYLLSTFSLRTCFFEKAGHYANAGFSLFPTDARLVEVHAFSLLLSGQIEDAKEVLYSSDLESENLEFLRCRVAMLTQGDKPEEMRSRVRKYLAFNAVR